MSGLSAIEYHERTKHSPESVRGGPSLDFDNKPRPYKAYNDLPRIPLEDAVPQPSMAALDAIANPDTSESADLTRESIAALCHYAAGITKTIRRHGREHEFRAAACTGALYHIDLYPVCGDLDDIEAGVYHYDPRSASLERLREGEFRGVLAKASGRDAVAEAPVTFIATSTWWRNAWKYGNRTNRHAFWDSGTVLANLLATAAAVGQPALIVMGFDDATVGSLLGLDPTGEAPLELVPVGTGSPATRRPEIPSIDPATEPLESEPAANPLIHRAWSASTLPDGEAASAWRTRGDRPIDGRGPGDGERIDLDLGAQPAVDRPLHATVRRRGSCREFDREAIPFHQLSTVLDRAMRGIAMDARAGKHGAGDPLQFVDCYLIANGIDDLDPGRYQVHPGSGELELLNAGECRRTAGQLALGQRLGADAAACLYFMADLDAITNGLGDRGYRVAQLEAASTAGRLYLATYAHRDLGGTGLTFFDDMVTEFLAPRARGQTPMFLYTIGRPA